MQQDMRIARNMTVLLATSFFTVAEAAFVGTYEVNHFDNTAGQYTDQSNPENDKANPYYGEYITYPSVFDGPIFIDAAPGTYTLVTVEGYGCSVWSGDSTSGTWSLAANQPGGEVTLEHTFGQIALYYWDWFSRDNDPNQKTTISVYSDAVVPEPSTYLAGLCCLGILGASVWRKSR